jgi:hypothetical protein
LAGSVNHIQVSLTFNAVATKVATK